MTAEPQKKKIPVVLIIIGAVIVLCIICGIIGTIAGSTPEAKATSTARAIARTEEASRPTAVPPTEAPTPVPPTATPAPTSTPMLPAPPYAEIRANVEGMTEAQWKAYLPTLKGLYVENWTGWVEEVNVVGSKYELWVDMDSPEEMFSVQDVYFEIPDDIALALQKDAPVTFSGQIEAVTEFLGSSTVHLKDATVQRSE